MNSKYHEQHKDLRCLVKSAKEESVSERIFVSVPPRIVDSLSSSDMVQTEGSNVTLECVASGSPQPAVVWRREDGREIEINKNTTGEMGWWWWW